MALAVTSKGTGQAKAATKVVSTSTAWAVDDIVIAAIVSDSIITSVSLVGVGALANDYASSYAGHLYVSVWHGKVSTAYTAGVVASNANADAKAIAVYKATGFADVSLDGYAVASSTGDTAPTSDSTGVLSAAAEVAIGVIGTEGPDGDTAGTWTTGAGYVSGNEQRLGTTGGDAASNVTVSTAAEVLAATTAQVAAKTGITSRCWTAGVVTYREIPESSLLPPGNLHVICKTATRVVLGWTDRATSETAYEMYQDGTLVATLAADSTEYIYAGLSAGTTYDFGIIVTDGTNDTAEVQISVTTRALPTGTREWTEVRPAGDVNAYWVKTAMSDNGRYILAGVAGHLYLSNDTGATWSEVTLGGAAGYRLALGISPSGEYMVAGEYDGRLWKSVDYGANWAEIRPAGDANKSWRSAAISDDGQFIIAGIYSGLGYTTSDAGATWNATASNWDWTCAAMSANGQYQLHTAHYNSTYNNGTVQFSYQFGLPGTWNFIATPASVPGSAGWRSTDMTSDGAVMVASAVASSGIHGHAVLSIDEGVTWEQLTPTGDVSENWYSISVSDNSAYIIMGDLSGRLWLSSDYGATWDEVRPSGADANKDWYSCQISANGRVAIAGEYGGRLWLGIIPTEEAEPMTRSFPWVGRFQLSHVL